MTSPRRRPGETLWERVDRLHAKAERRLKREAGEVREFVKSQIEADLSRGLDALEELLGDDDE